MQTCIQKNILLLLVLNLRTKTLPVVQAGTALNSTSSGKMIRSSLNCNLSFVANNLGFLDFQCVVWIFSVLYDDIGQKKGID